LKWLSEILPAPLFQRGEWGVLADFLIKPKMQRNTLAAFKKRKCFSDLFLPVRRTMNKFRFFTLLILSLSAILLCHGGGGGGGSEGGGGVGGGGETSGTIKLAWEASPDPAAIGHWIYYGIQSPYENHKDAGPTPGPSITSFYTLNGLSKGQIYQIAVKAYDRHGNESDPCGPVSGEAK